MSYPKVQFVASPNEGAEVRFDFNDHGLLTAVQPIVFHDGFTLGSPTVFGEPGMVGRRRGYRSISWEQGFDGSNTAVPNVLTSLAREVERDENWLRFQMSPSTPPMWIRTYLTQQQGLSFEDVSDDPGSDLYRISISLDADPYFLGEERELLDTVLGNNPLDDGCYMELPDVAGDAQAPLRLEVTPSVGWDGQTPLLASAHADPSNPYPGIIVWPAGDFTAGTDTGSVTASAAYFGTGYRQVSFATPTMAKRLSGAVPVTPPLGRYKVLARIGRSDTSSTFAMRLGQVYGLSQVRYGETVQMTRGLSAAADFRTWVDLGEFSFPLDSNPAESDLIPAVSTPSIEFDMQRLTGTGEARINGFVLIPVELAGARAASILKARFHAVGLSNVRVGHFDGQTSAFRAYEVSGGTLTQGLSPRMSGRWPSVVPGEQNVLHVLQQTFEASPFFLTDDNADNLAATATVRAYYRPHYTWLGSDA